MSSGLTRESTLRTAIRSPEKSGTVSRLTVGTLALGAVLALSGCSPGASERPDPVPLVQDYLTAIAEGDADTAAALDEVAVKLEAEQTSRAEDGDLTTLRSPAVLEHAEERISDITVDETTGPEPGSDGEARRVMFEFTLDGERHSSSLAVRWNEDAYEWELQESLTQWMSVLAVENPVSMEWVPFTVPGIAETLSADASSPTSYFLTYFGVYEVNAAFDTSVLQRGVESRQIIAVIPAQETAVQFDVTSLPSSTS